MREGLSRDVRVYISQSVIPGQFFSWMWTLLFFLRILQETRQFLTVVARNQVLDQGYRDTGWSFFLGLYIQPCALNFKFMCAYSFETPSR